MSVIGETTKAIRMTLVLWVLTAVIYPILVLAISQVAFPYQANGSLVQNLEGNLIGSALIGQAFTSDQYFSSRPSTTNYSQGKEAVPTGLSSASNLAPSNPDLLKRIQAEVTRLQEINVRPTADLVYTSGSSLDPHITVENALSQLERVATARNLSSEDIVPLIAEHTQGRLLGIFGEPRVNVLGLNRELNLFAFSRQPRQ